MHINVTRYTGNHQQGPHGGGNPLVFWLLIKWLCLTAAIMFTAYLVEGIEVAGFAHALGTAAVLGVLNVIVRPILFILTLPINVMTLGLFTFVINALMLKIASVIPGFSVVGFWAAVFGALIISAVTWILNALIRDSTTRGGGHRRPGDEYIDMKKHDDRWE
ncbi:MAG: phage holin family protein [Desulfobacterales bacterium]|nr:phage holin family protein [Desulfobacterales bacterium]